MTRKRRAGDTVHDLNKVELNFAQDSKKVSSHFFNSDFVVGKRFLRLLCVPYPVLAYLIG